MPLRRLIVPASRGAAALLTILTGCADDLTTSPLRSPASLNPGAESPALVQTDRSAEIRAGILSSRGGAAEQIAAAVAGRRWRGAQDDMLRIEAQVPGFAGFFVVSGWEPVLRIKGSASPERQQLLKQVVYSHFDTTASEVVRTIMAKASNARVLPADFSLSELIAMESAITADWPTVDGFKGVGTNVAANRVQILVTDSAHIPSVRSALLNRGIAERALTFVVEPVTEPSVVRFTDQVRPTRGGLRIALHNPAWMSSNQDFGQSHGFNVRLDNQAGQPTRMLTAAHGPNIVFMTNGHLGATVYQADPTSFGSTLATITTNPAWLTPGPGCEGDADFCTTFDAAVGSLVAGASGERKIGVSVTGGYNGNPGSQTINNWYSVTNVVDPSFAITDAYDGVHKSGFRTGTTTGYMNLPLTTIQLNNVAWGPNQTRRVRFIDFSRVAAIGWGGGDSGAPVYVQGPGCGPYCAIGLQSLGGATSTQNGICTSGQNCVIYVTRWDRMTTGLGLGTLNPRTNP